MGCFATRGTGLRQLLDARSPKNGVVAGKTLVGRVEAWLLGAVAGRDRQEPWRFGHADGGEDLALAEGELGALVHPSR